MSKFPCPVCHGLNTERVDDEEREVPAGSINPVRWVATFECLDCSGDDAFFSTTVRRAAKAPTPIK